MQRMVVVLAVSAAALPAFGQDVFVRQYREREKPTYVMKGINEGQQYMPRALDGRCVDEFAKNR